MANDPQPDGFIGVRRAFEKVIETWGFTAAGEEYRARSQEVRAAEFQMALRAERLVAKVFHQGLVHVIPAELWGEGPFPTRVFYADDVLDDGRGGWRAYAGRTPFIQESQFNAWLSQTSGVVRARKALAQGYLTPDEALNWLLWQDISGPTMDRLVSSSLGDGIPAVMSFDEAGRLLVSLLREHDGVAVETDIASGSVRHIGREQFSDPHIVHDVSSHVITRRRWKDEPKVGRASFNDLRIDARAVINLIYGEQPIQSGAECFAPIEPIVIAPGGPSGNPNAGGKNHRKANAVKAAATEWLRAIMAASPTVQKVTKDELRPQAMAEFPGLTRRDFDRKVWPKCSQDYPAWRGGTAVKYLRSNP